MRKIMHSLGTIVLLFGILGCPNHENKFEPAEVIGRYGSGLGEFDTPRGIILGIIEGRPYQCLFVADYGNNRVQVCCKEDGNKYSYYAFGSYGKGNGQFDGPIAVAVTRNDRLNSNTPLPPNPRIYVADSKNHRIQKFDVDGNFLLTWGSYGIDSGQFNTPTGIDVDFEGNVYVVDSGNHRVQVFDTLGNFVRMWGEKGSGNQEFNSPIDIVLVFDKYRQVTHIAVSDNENNRVQIYDRNGVYLGSANGIIKPLGVAEGLNIIWVISAQRKGLYHFSYINNEVFFDGLGDMSSPYDFDIFYISDCIDHKIYRYESTLSY